MIPNSSRFYGLISLALALSFFSCKKDEDSSTTPSNSNPKAKTGILEVNLTDARGDYKAVWIDIEDVEFNFTDSASSGWSSLNGLNPGMYDLLKLSNGLDTLLGTAVLPPGKVNQIRLILGMRNYVVLKGSGDSIAMNTPSAQQSGLKININDSLKAGITYSITLDFDAGKSVVKAGKSGKYILKPVIRAFSTATSGAIKGNAQPDSVSIAAMAIQGTDTFGTYTDSTGGFLIQGLDAGTYDVYLDPGSLSSLGDTMISPVTVITGTVTDIGTITLQ